MKKFLFTLAAAVVLVALSSAAHADELFVATFSGSQEVPPVASPGSGEGRVRLDGNMLTFEITFRGLLAPTVDAHIHCCAPPGANAGVAIGFPSTGFPLGVTTGSYTNTFNLLDSAIYTAGFLAAGGGTAAGAAALLTTNLRNGQTYLNIHTTQFRGGEIRGQVQAVPEPATLLLLGTGFAAVAGRKFHRRSK